MTDEESGNKIFRVLKRNGEIALNDEKGRELERHKVPYGAVISVADGDAVGVWQQGGELHHAAAVRLARYLLNTLRAGDTFVDIGAHYRPHRALGLVKPKAPHYTA